MNAINPQFLEALAWTLIHFLWQGLVIGVVAALALWSLRNSKPQARYTAALLAFVACVVAPPVTFAFLWTQFSAQPSWAGGADTTMATALEFARYQNYPAWLLKLWPDLPSFLVAAWSAGVLIGGVKLFTSFLGVQWVRRQGIEPVPARLQAMFDELCAEFEMTGRAALRVSNRILSPMTVGWLRPLVLVPASAWLGLRQDELRLILAHELAHIRRWDYLVNLLQQLTVTFLFYHPVVHWLSRVLSEEREMCCDEMVVGSSEAKRLAYAKALLHLQEQHSHLMRLVMSARGGPFLRRVYRLLTKQENREAPRTAVNGLVGLLMVSVVNLVFMLHTNDAVANFSHGILSQEEWSLNLSGARADYPMDEVLADVRSSWETALERQALDLGPPLQVGREISMAETSAPRQSSMQRGRSGQGAGGHRSNTVYQLPALQTRILTSLDHASAERGPSFDLAAAKALARAAMNDAPAQPEHFTNVELDSSGSISADEESALALADVKPTLARLDAHASSARDIGPERTAKISPRLLHMVQPNFPISARNNGARGDVRLIYRLYPDGRVRDVQIEPGSDAHPALVKAAVEALEAWEYEPFDYDRPLVMAQTFRFLRKSSGSDEGCFSRLKDSCARNVRAMDSIMVNDGLSSTDPEEMAAEAAVKWTHRT